MGSKIIGARIQADRSTIIAMYADGVPIAKLASDYDVKVDTLCRRLRQWGEKIKRNDWHKKVKGESSKRKFSPELLAKREVNTRTNNDPKKGIQYVNFTNTTEDQRLVANIISHAIIG